MALQFAEQRAEFFHAGDLREYFAEGGEGRGDVSEEMGAGVGVTEFAEGAEGLHEALHGAEVVEGAEVGGILHICDGEVVVLVPL